MGFELKDVTSFGIPVYVQEAQPVLTRENTIAIWEKPSTGMVLLIYCATGGTDKATELNTLLP